MSRAQTILHLLEQFNKEDMKRSIQSIIRIMDRFVESQDLPSLSEKELRQYPSRMALSKLLHDLASVDLFRMNLIDFEAKAKRASRKIVLEFVHKPGGGVFYINSYSPLAMWLEDYNNNWRYFVSELIEAQGGEERDQRSYGYGFDPDEERHQRKRSDAARRFHRERKKEYEPPRKGGHPRGSLLSGRMTRDPELMRWRTHRGSRVSIGRNKGEENED